VQSERHELGFSFAACYSYQTTGPLKHPLVSLHAPPAYRTTDVYQGGPAPTRMTDGI